MQSAATYWQKEGRSLLWQKLQQLGEQQAYDVIVIGGGITGAGVALEAAKHGQKVLLVERQDYAWGTSSRSSKMVHGGLRYMAQGDLKTTRESVQERERLLKEAPGLVSALEYALPHYQRQFPPFWMFYALLWLYDLFAGKRYRTWVRRSRFLADNPLLKTQGLQGASQFTDAVTDDSRLVLRVLQEAQRWGVECINYVAVSDLVLQDKRVVGVDLVDQRSEQRCQVRASVVINATGVWVDELRQQVAGAAKIRPARGSHLVIAASRLPVSQSLTLLHPDDQRPVFVYPWEGRTVIGTTDIDHGPVVNQEVAVSEAEMHYLFRLVQHYFPSVVLQEQDVIASFSGVRPLIAGGALNPSKEKRNHSVWQEQGLISVSGGKLTTFRLIALDTLASAKAFLPSWTKQAPSSIFSASSCTHPAFQQLAADTQQRLLGYYGERTDLLMDLAQTDELHNIAEIPLLWAELRYSARYEGVQHLDDLLLRRTRLGLLLPQGGMAQAEKIQHICQQELGWSEAEWQREAERYAAICQRYYGVPREPS